MIIAYAKPHTVTLKVWNLALDFEHENLILTVNGEHKIALDPDTLVTFLEEIDADPKSVEVLEDLHEEGENLLARHLTVVFENSLDVQQLHADIAGGTYLEDLGLVG